MSAAFAIEAEGLTVRFGDHTALEEIGFRLEEGGFLSIVGPNGAGKSTLLKAIIGLVAPQAGSIRVFGAPPSKRLPGSIGYVPQIKTLDRHFPALAIELVATGLLHRWPAFLDARTRARALMTLQKMGAEHVAFRQLAKLSGGELQRVYLARGLVSQPRIVLLDEPATGIDAAGQANLYQLLEDYKHQSGATVVMITHDWNAACHLCSHVMVLNRRLLGFGPPLDSVTDDGMRQAFGHVGHAHDMWLGIKKHA